MTTSVQDEICRFLSQSTLDSFATLHHDLGYGFGAWSPSFLRAFGAQGWIGLTWPEEFGGLGRPAADLLAMMREIAYHQAPAEALFYSLAVGQCIVAYGSDQLRKETLPAILRGEMTFCEALSEPNAGSDVLSLRTRVEDRGSHYELTGKKIWISNGWCAEFALVLARTGSSKRGHDTSCLLVDLDSPGVDRRAVLDLAGEPSFSEISFDDVRVPKHHLLGQLGSGLTVLLDMLEWDRLWARAAKPAFLRRECERLIEYAQSKWRGDMRLWDDACVRDMVAGAYAEIEVCDALVDQAVVAHGKGGTVQYGSLLKILADDVGQRFYEAARQVLECDIHRGDAFSRDVRQRGLSALGVMIAGGTKEMQTLTVSQRTLYFPKA